MREIPLRPIGHVARAGDPESEVIVYPEFQEGLAGLSPGDDLLVLFWMDRADRGRLMVHPRGDPARPLKGVFATRSPHRPNPIGATVVTLVAIEGTRLTVRGLDAWEGSPILDLKIARGGGA